MLNCTTKFIFTLLSVVATSLLVYGDQRGLLSDHDIGPDPRTTVGAEYARIFSTSPNYRALSMATMGRESFSWEYGPTFYRGQLGQNQVKVLIIGPAPNRSSQVTHRAFSSSLGGYAQSLINYLGYESNYLLINAFSYPLTEPYSKPVTIQLGAKSVSVNFVDHKMYQLAQNPLSPLVKWRHKLVDHIAQSNKGSLELIITIGRSASDSLATYLTSKGLKCPSAVSKLSAQQFAKKNKISLITPYQYGVNLNDCSFRGDKGVFINPFSEKLKVIHFLSWPAHSPGVVDYELKIKRTISLLKKWHTYDSTWSMTLKNKSDFVLGHPFRLTKSPIPLKDYSFGVTQLASGPETLTTQESFTPRSKNSGRLFISFGSKQNGSFKFSTKDMYKSYFEKPTPFADASDHIFKNVPWEPSKIGFLKFDRGPGAYWAEVFTGARHDVPSPDRDVFKPHSETSLLLVNTSARSNGSKSFYRGRPHQTEVLILADQQSHDDTFSGRALTGFEGQRLQSLLYSIKAGTNYTILRTLPFDTLGLSQDKMDSLIYLTQPWRRAVWEKLIKNSNNKFNIKLIFVLGPCAESLLNDGLLDNYNIPVVSLNKRSFVDMSITHGIDFLPTKYQQAFNKVLQTKTWTRSEMEFSEALISIPRVDLPWGLPRWVGTSGDRVIRSKIKNDEYIYKIIPPEWVYNHSPRPLNDDDNIYIKKITIPPKIKKIYYGNPLFILK